MRWPILVAAAVLFCVACNKSNLDEEIIGVWENAGTPASMALPESARRSASWSAKLRFDRNNKFEWQVDNGVGGSDVWSGSYGVVGFSVSIEITKVNGKELQAAERLEYTVRQQSTGSIRLPLPQDWTGPSVDYFPER
jgi:hypothetical protein